MVSIDTKVCVNESVWVDVLIIDTVVGTIVVNVEISPDKVLVIVVETYDVLTIVVGTRTVSKLTKVWMTVGPCTVVGMVVGTRDT